MVTRGKGETNVRSLDVSCPNGVSVRAVRSVVGSSVPFGWRFRPVTSVA